MLRTQSLINLMVLRVSGSKELPRSGGERRGLCLVVSSRNMPSSTMLWNVGISFFSSAWRGYNELDCVFRGLDVFGYYCI